MISLIDVHTDTRAVGQGDQLEPPKSITVKKAFKIIDTII